MAHKIQIKRGNKADLPVLNDGELGLCQDTNELFIGNDGNQKIFPPTAPTISDVEGLQTALGGKVDNSRVLTDVPANAKFTDTVYTHPATHSADMIVDGTTNKAYTATEKNKLAGIETGANKTTIANNLTETVTGKALDATQGKALAEQISTKSTTTTYTTTLDTTWSGTEAPYTKAQTVSGILSTDNPIVDIVTTGTYETDVQIETDWANIYRIVTSENTVTFYAHAKPTGSIPLQLKVVR